MMTYIIGKLFRNEFHTFFNFNRNVSRTFYLSINNRNEESSKLKQSPNSIPIQTMQEAKANLAKEMGITVTGFKPILESRAHLLNSLPASQSELEPRSMQDSFTTALIPLSTDKELQDKYITFLGSVRLGRLLEDMDIFAVCVVQQHIKNPKRKPDMPSPYTLVTLLVDKIDFTDFKPTPYDDIRLSGHVSWVGKSSVEVVVWLEQMRHNQWQKLTRALFLIAARDPTNTRAAFVNPIEPANENERNILKDGEARKQKRLMIKAQSLLKVIPSDIEQKLVHDLFTRTLSTDECSFRKRTLPTGCFWMESSTLSNIIFSHPEHRNLHNKVFGGFIMRQAVELSWVLGYLSSKYRPELNHISDIGFYKPIEVNSLIRMHAYVVYTEMQYMQITVYVESFEPRTGIHNTTNAFHFTYELPEIVAEVFPNTYQEAMMYIDGRRHFLDARHQQIIDSNVSYQ